MSALVLSLNDQINRIRDDVATGKKETLHLDFYPVELARWALRGENLTEGEIESITPENRAWLAALLKKHPRQPLENLRSYLARISSQISKPLSFIDDETQSLRNVIIEEPEIDEPREGHIKYLIGAEMFYNPKPPIAR